MIEEWKLIPSFDGYEASNLGNIRNKRFGKNLKLQNTSYGYKSVSLRKNKKVYTKLVHRLVAEAFGLNLNKKVVDHINENKNDNRIINLRTCTQTENLNFAKKRILDTNPIKAFRLFFGLSVNDVCKTLDMDMHSYNKLESSKTNATKENISSVLIKLIQSYIFKEKICKNPVIETDKNSIIITDSRIQLLSKIFFANEKLAKNAAENLIINIKKNN